MPQDLSTRVPKSWIPHTVVDSPKTRERSPNTGPAPDTRSLPGSPNLGIQSPATGSPEAGEGARWDSKPLRRKPLDPPQPKNSSDGTSPRGVPPRQPARPGPRTVLPAAKTPRRAPGRRGRRANRSHRRHQRFTNRDARGTLWGPPSSLPRDRADGTNAVLGGFRSKTPRQERGLEARVGIGAIAHTPTTDGVQGYPSGEGRATSTLSAEDILSGSPTQFDK